MCMKSFRCLTISAYKSFAELIDLTSPSKPEDLEIITIDCSPEQQEVTECFETYTCNREIYRLGAGCELKTSCQLNILLAHIKF